MRTTGAQLLTVQTPEGIEFSFQLAGPLARFLAWAVDAAVIFASMSALAIPFKILGVFSVDFSRAVSILLFFSVSIGYRIFMEWKFGGQTLGKRLLRLRVLDSQGLQIEFSQIVIRNLLRFIDCLPAFYMVGGLAGLFSVRAQRLGDLAAGTIVVVNLEYNEPDLNQLLQGKFNSFIDYPHLAARLRQRTSVQMARVALMALLRRESLDPAARVDLFKRIADAFRDRVRFPAEITEGMSDERYVRNCVDLLYQKKH